MQVSVEDTGGLERRLTVNIPEDEFIGKIETRLRDLCKQVKIKGFRPGRVPMSVVKQRYGKQVRLEARQRFLKRAWEQAVHAPPRRRRPSGRKNHHGQQRPGNDQ